MNSFGKKKKYGFTLAEVLITLVVIGVVAAITIPVIIQNTNGKEYNAAKQKIRSSLGEAFKLKTIDGPPTAYPNGAEDFVEKDLQKYIKVAKICKGDNAPTDCGFPEKFKTPEGDSVNSSDLKNWSSWLENGKVYISVNGTVQEFSPSGSEWKAGFFQTLDGFSIALLYYPKCGADEFDNAWGNQNIETRGMPADTSFSAVCFNAVYDMNGKKGPNRVGDDIGFVGSFYYGINTRSAAVLPVAQDKSGINFYQADLYCKSLSKDFELPSIDELSLMFINNKGVGNSTNRYWSRTAASNPDEIRYIEFYQSYGYRTWQSKSYIASHTIARCVRADQLM